MNRNFTEEEHHWSKWALEEEFDKSRLNDNNTDCLAIIAACHMAGALIADAYKKGDRGRAATLKHIWEGEKNRSEKEIWKIWTILYTQALEKNDNLVSIDLIETYVLRTYCPTAIMNLCIGIEPSLEHLKDIFVRNIERFVGKDREKVLGSLDWKIDGSRPAHSKTATVVIKIINTSDTPVSETDLKATFNLFHTQHLPPLNKIDEQDWNSSPYYMAVVGRKA